MYYVLIGGNVLFIMANLYKKCISFMLTLMIVVACQPLVPATVPPQLSHTPGEFIRIDDDRVYVDDFSVAYPEGWRVIKISMASDPVRFVFASPDNTMLITISANPIVDDVTPDATKTIHEDERDGIYFRGEALVEDDDVFEEIYEGIVQSTHRD